MGQEREVAVVINGKMRNPSGDGNILYLECICQIVVVILNTIILQYVII